MNAAAMTFEVVDLARIEALNFERQQPGLARGRPLLNLFLQRPVRWLAGYVCRKIDGKASGFARQAVFFRGARDRLESVGAANDAIADLAFISLLQHMESDLLALRNDTLSLIKQKSDPNSESVRMIDQAMSRFAAAAAELYEEVLDFRGALQAFEADHSERLSGFVACTPQELDATFARIFDGA